MTLFQEYSEQGFVVVPGVVSQDAIQALFDTTLRVFKRYNPNSALPDSGLSYDDERFSERLIRFRSESPQQFGMFYDTMQTSVALFQLTCARVLVDTAATLLGDTIHGLSATGHMTRMDAPNDDRNSLEWHQEAAYYRQNRVPGHGIVVWTPLHDLTREHGPVIVCPGSHTRGLLDVAGTGKGDYHKSQQYQLPEDVVAQYEPHQVVANAGDALFFHMSLFHRSGANVSRRIRFVAGARYHRILTDDFVPGRLVYKPNETAAGIQ